MERFDQDGREPHHPVLYQPIITALKPASPGRYVDATVGAGGHAAGILQASAPAGQLIGFDLDPQALALAKARLHPFSDRFWLFHSSYIHLKEKLQAQGWQSVNGILIDLGVSSMQLDQAERGFSFLKDGPLDMRFDPARGMSAADLINSLPAEELAEIFWRFGEEREARRLARLIVAQRPFHTTAELAELIRSAQRGKPSRIHPATRVFQALRIAVNGELDSLSNFLPQAIELLAPGGRLAVISFHSLEDRIVKHYFRQESRDCLCPPNQPVCTCGHKATIREINRKPLEADAEEIRINPRARSAKLRIAEKLTILA